MRAFNNDGQKYMSLTGVIMNIEYAKDDLTPKFDRLKESYFQDHHPDDPVIFHRADMVRNRDAFRALKDDELRNEFDADLLQAIEGADFKVITVGIDKESHARHYVEPAHTYHYLLELLTERYVWHLRDLGARGDIFVEARSPSENTLLNREYEAFYEAGNGVVSANTVQRHLTGRRLEFKRKDQNVAGLQLTDLVAFPSHRYLVCREQDRDLDSGFTPKVVDILVADKYRRRYDGRIEGYGTKWLK
jgi:hypothetical protein